MLSKILDKKNPAFDVIQEPGRFVIIHQEDKRKKVLKIVAFLYLLVAISLSVIVLTAYFKGAKIYDGEEMPLWFLAVILFSEWLPAYFIFWLAFSTSTYLFDHSSLIVQIGSLGIRRNKISLPKNNFHKVMIICQSGNSSICTLTVQAEASEQKILWLHPYDQCLWLGSVIAEWAGVPVENYQTRGFDRYLQE